jgi:hypothetical protein
MGQCLSASAKHGDAPAAIQVGHELRWCWGGNPGLPLMASFANSTLVFAPAGCADSHGC